MNRLRRLAFAAAAAAATSVAMLGGVAATAAHAQDAPDSAPANVAPEEARAQQFQRVDGPQTEAIAAAPLLVGAYATIWVLLFGYLFLVARRQAATRAEIDALEKLVVARARAADAQHQHHDSGGHHDSVGSSLAVGLAPTAETTASSASSVRPPSEDGAPAATDEPTGAS